MPSIEKAERREERRRREREGQRGQSKWWITVAQSQARRAAELEERHARAEAGRKRHERDGDGDAGRATPPDDAPPKSAR